MTEIDISKVLIEGDTATIMGVKYKRVVEEPKTLTDLIGNWWCDIFCANSMDDMETCIDGLVDRIEKWLPKEQSANSQNTYVELTVEGFNDAIDEIRSKLR